MAVGVDEARAKIAARRLWYWSTATLDADVRSRVDSELNGCAEGNALPSSSNFVRRALGDYLAHVAAGGEPETEPARDPGNPLTSATLKCYAHVPHALYTALTTYLQTLPPRTNQGGKWPHSSRKSSVIRQAIRFWIRRHP